MMSSPSEMYRLAVDRQEEALRQAEVSRQVRGHERKAGLLERLARRSSWLGALL